MAREENEVSEMAKVELSVVEMRLIQEALLSRRDWLGGQYRSAMGNASYLMALQDERKKVFALSEKLDNFKEPAG